MIKSRVVVYTARYKVEYGKCPRGYGSWIFQTCRDEKGKRHEFEYVGMYKDAKEKAIEFACEKNCSCLTLMS